MNDKKSVNCMPEQHVILIFFIWWLKVFISVTFFLSFLGEGGCFFIFRLKWRAVSRPLRHKTLIPFKHIVQKLWYWYWLVKNLDISIIYMNHEQLRSYDSLSPVPQYLHWQGLIVVGPSS